MHVLTYGGDGTLVASEQLSLKTKPAYIKSFLPLFQYSYFVYLYLFFWCWGSNLGPFAKKVLYH